MKGESTVPVLYPMGVYTFAFACVHCANRHSDKCHLCKCEKKSGFEPKRDPPVIAFEIPYPATKRGKAAWNKRFGLNAYYAGKHWSQRKKDAEDLHELAHWAMRKAGITKRLVNHPVKVTFFWNDNLDVDNHGALGKACVDAMKGYILPDDNRKWFRAVEHKFWGGDTIRVEIEEAE